MKVIPLAVAGAFHTSIMDSAVPRLTSALQAARLRTPRIPVLSNVDAQVHADPDELRDVLGRQVVNPVRWEATVRQLLEDGYNLFYEIGPGKVLKGLMKRIDRKVPITTVNDSFDE